MPSQDGTDSAATDIFILGPARSGTSWLQTMLAEHPQIASPPETEFFSAYLVPMERSWRRHRDIVDAAGNDPNGQLAYGLATVFSDAEFDGLLRSLYDAMRETVLAAKPGAHRLLEKTPDHVLFIETLRRLIPDASLVFLVRDPRDVVRSLLEASREPWGHWAPTSVADATELWLRNVRAGLRNVNDDRMITVRYEDLHATNAELERISTFLGLGAPSEWLENAVEASPGQRSSIVRRETLSSRVNPYEARGFSFHDRAQRRTLSASERAYIEWRCRPEMARLGYPFEQRRARLALLPRRVLSRVRARALNRRRRSRGTKMSDIRRETANTTNEEQC